MSYVAAAYIAFLTLLVVYVAIMARRIGRLERRISDEDPR